METVLILDADVLVRHPLAEFLRSCGLDVVEAATVEEARAFLEERALGVDVALVAARGAAAREAFAFARLAREIAPGVAVMLVGAIDAAVDRAAELCADGPGGPKPIDRRALADEIARLRAARARRAS